MAIEIKATNSTTVRFDGGVLTIERGHMSAAGRGTMTWPAASISAVQLHKSGMMGGLCWVEFISSGVSNEKIKSAGDAMKLDHAVAFKKGQMGEFEELRDAIYAARSGGTAIPPASSNFADELDKLVRLRDAGALTPDEFAAQKAKLIG